MSRFEDDEGFDGVEFHTPVGSFRAGRGHGGPSDADDEEYRRARRRVHRVMGFYRHVTTFISVLLVLLVIDILDGTDAFFTQWVALIWGIILTLHFLNVYAFDFFLGRDAERRMIERELRKGHGR